MSRETVICALVCQYYGANKKIIIKKKKTKIDRTGARLRRTEAMPTASYWLVKWLSVSTPHNNIIRIGAHTARGETPHCDNL